MNIGKVTKVPAELQAATALRKAIIGGAIAPGSRITEGGIAEKMQLSRATVRGALHLLETEGLTVLRRYSGWSVACLSADDVRELYTIRSALERLAARLAAASMNGQKSVELKKSLSALTKRCAVGVWNSIADADFRFHKKIVAMSGNSRLVAQYDALEPQIRMYLGHFGNLPQDPAVIIRDHEAIAEAIVNSDVVLAGDLSEKHNFVDGEILAKHLEGQV